MRTHLRAVLLPVDSTYGKYASPPSRPCGPDLGPPRPPRDGEYFTNLLVRLLLRRLSRRAVRENDELELD